MKVTQDRNIRKKRRVRAKISGTAKRPRIAVHRSHKYIYVQVIDDVTGKTLDYASSTMLKKSKTKQTKSEQALEVGKTLGKSLLAKKIKQGVFDRSRFAYNGRVKMLADGMREAGFTI